MRKMLCGGDALISPQPLSAVFVNDFVSGAAALVAESKIEAQTSPAKIKARMGKDVTLWCNATGYPKPMVYWTREDRNRKLSDGSYQNWVRARVCAVTLLHDSDTLVHFVYCMTYHVRFVRCTNVYICSCLRVPDVTAVCVPFVVRVTG